jgi:hypothetical protein
MPKRVERALLAGRADTGISVATSSRAPAAAPLLPRASPRPHDSTATRRLDQLELGTIQPRIELAAQEQATTSTRRASMRDLAQTHPLLHGAMRTPQELGHILGQQVRRSAHYCITPANSPLPSRP